MTFYLDSRRGVFLQPIGVNFECFARRAFQIITIKAKVNILERARRRRFAFLQLIQTRLPSRGFASGPPLSLAGTRLCRLGRCRPSPRFPSLSRRRKTAYSRQSQRKKSDPLYFFHNRHHTLLIFG